ncbi:MAG: gliding motility-associated C-terminal domain-containing protein, partial [Cyclobacteriaceae bacterium]
FSNTSSPSSTFTPAGGSGNYVLTWSIGNGICPVSQSNVTITVSPNNTAGAPSSNPTLCVNTVLTNITHTTTGATGIGAPTGLPAGVTAAWAANVITISGTPTATGTFNYSIPLTGGCGTVTATGTINVTSDNTAGPASSTPTLCVNTALTNITHATTGATGIGAPTRLPAGVTAAWAANVITISGTPTATGTFNYSIPLTGGCGTVNATGTITVSVNNTVSAASSTPTLCINTALTNITHTTTGATGIGAPTGLPAGVTAIWAANVITISGTPTASGTFNYSIPLTGGCGTINATGTIIVNPAPVTSSISGSSSVCENATASAYSVTNTIGSTYSWTITGGVQASGTNTNSITVNWGAAGAGSVSVTETNSNTCVGTAVTLPVTINALPSGSLSGNASICVGQPTTLTINLTGTGPWNISYSDGSTVTPINGIATSPHTFTVNPFITTTYSLVAVSDANCTGAPSGTALVIVNPIPGDQVTFGNDTWIGYVYNDAASPSPPVSNINYSGAKYRGFVNEVEIGSFGTSTYDLSKDAFDLNLGNAIPISGTNICGSFVDDFSVRFKMRKTLSAGIYNFNVSGDDGVRLFIDGALVTVTPANSFTTHSYTTYTASHVCITAGQHDFIIEYFERGGFARVSFDYQIVPAPAVISPVAVCVNTTAPTLTVNPVDATATGYRWFSDAALTTQVGSGSSFTPSAAQLDLTVAATTSFFVAADYACGQGPSAQVDVNVVSSATITNPATAPTVCQTGGTIDLTTLVTVSPAGGTLTFAGTGVTGNNFDPTGLTGAIAITPSYSVGTCAAPSTAFNINVTTSASVTVPASTTTICQSAAAIDLTTLVSGSPAGGTFTTFVGPGVAGTFFNPATLSGTQSITANYSIGGCTGSGVILIDVINTATLNLPATQTVCQTGGNVNLASLVTATPAGGTFTFTGTGVNSPAATFNPSGLSGLQTINVSYNAAGCSATGSFQFNVINTASLNLTNSNICRNAGPLNLITLATASPSGGAFSFSGTQVAGSLFDPTGLSGAINIAVSYNQGGCTANGTLTMTVLDSSNPSCTPTGNCATVVITPVPAPATCTLSNGSINFNISPATPTINNTGVKITITGVSTTNSTISRTNFNDPAFPALPIGVYNYVIEYGDPSCTKNGQVTIDQSGTVGTPVASNILGPQCAGASTGSLQLDVPGETGNLLQWSLDGITFTNFTAGSVITGIPAGLAPSFQRVLSVRRNASDPCFAAVTVTIQDVNPAITTTLTTTDATCANNDGTVVIGAISGGVAPYTFLLDGAAKVLPGNNTFTDQTGGSHTFSVVDANGCQRDFPYTINFPGLVNYTTAITPPDCSANGTNGTILLTITSAGTFQVGITTDPVNAPTTIQNVISNGSTVVPFGGLSNNTYYISMTPTGAACPTKTLGLVISTGPSEVDFAVAPLDITCFEDKGGVALTSIKGSLTVNYTYEIVDSNGNLVPAASVSPANPITQLQALGTVNLTGLDKGDYKIRLYQDQSVATGCTNPISSAFKSITIAGPSASLDTLFTVRKISLPDLATGSLLIGIKESQQEPYEIQLELKTPVISGQFYLLNPFGVPARNPQNLIMQYEAKNLFAGLYELKITDALGCQKVYPDIEIKVDTEIFIPNVFTPNGDQTNDTFYIRNLPPGSQVNITNRWGAEIYSSSNYENNWDGGTTADGIYFYRVTAGGTVFTGWLEIIRGQ